MNQIYPISCSYVHLRYSFLEVQVLSETHWRLHRFHAQCHNAASVLRSHTYAVTSTSPVSVSDKARGAHQLSPSHQTGGKVLFSPHKLRFPLSSVCPEMVGAHTSFEQSHLDSGIRTGAECQTTSPATGRVKSGVYPPVTYRPINTRMHHLHVLTVITHFLCVVLVYRCCTD